LVAGLFMLNVRGGDAQQLESLDRKNKRFQAASWPAPLESARANFEKQFAQLPHVLTGHEATYYPWTFYGDAAALVRPVFKISVEPSDSDMLVQPVGLLIIQIDSDYLKKEYLPDLVDRDFGPSGFRVAIRTANPPYSAIYSSDSDFPIATTSADAELNLLNSVAEEARRRGDPPVAPGDPAKQWQLVAQHPSGSLHAAGALWREHNLAIGLGLLAILAGCTALVLSVSRRAERLGKFQMQFVAGISHELCTPLAVINSAVENLADGVVDHPGQIQEYAAILRDQSGRLERLMDQVLVLASGRLGQSTSDVRPVDVATIVAQTIAASEPLLRDAGFILEKEIAFDLPPVFADSTILGKCVENLISNATKYGGENRWIAVRARISQVRSRSEVQISVEDKGIGIPSADQKHIFEPFYRVQAVRDRQIRGVGLGLYLVKRMIEEMGGRITLSSEIGHGSCFVLHIPVPSAVEHPHSQPALSRTT
jgi:signal transduction histidine kinase